MSNTITAYKGFDKDLKCRGFQFEVGDTYTQDGHVEACRNGFHACASPFDVWSDYTPAMSRFAIVEQSGDIARHESDSKIASATIHIRAELTLPEFIQRGVEWIVDNAKGKEKIHNTGDQSAASNTGYQSAASNTGYQSAASNTGNYSAASVEGESTSTMKSGAGNFIWSNASVYYCYSRSNFNSCFVSNKENSILSFLREKTSKSD